MARARGVIVTVDGPAASGKSTAARNLAAALRLPFIGTGALYRAVALAALRRRGGVPSDAGLIRIARGMTVTFVPSRGRRGARVHIGGRDVTDELQLPEVARLASERVAGVPRVRDAVNAMARRLAAVRGAVAEGRDCGTVIFPDAPIKLFLTASVAERVRRRLLDLRQLGLQADPRKLARDIRRRDHTDATRPVGALRPAVDAWIVDTTGQTPAAMHRRLLRLTGRCR